jgi:hypothetical protein
VEKRGRRRRGEGEATPAGGRWRVVGDDRGWWGKALAAGSTEDW